MLNQCQFIGHLGADPEVRNTQSGSKIVNMRIACTEKWRTREGERKEKTEWIPITIFSEPLARVAEQYLRKGSKVFVSGQFTTRKWQDQSGADRYSTEVVLRPFKSELTMLDGKSDGNSGGSDGGYSQGERGRPPEQYGQQSSGGYGGGPMGDLDDEIPFAAEFR